MTMKNDEAMKDDEAMRLECNERATSIPFGLPHRPKTTHTAETHYLDVKAWSCPAKRNLRLARADNNLQGRRCPVRAGLPNGTLRPQEHALAGKCAFSVYRRFLKKIFFFIGG